MRPMLAAALLALTTAGGTAALADGGMTVTLPDVSGLSDGDAKALITQLAQVNVITSNCPAWPITDGEWTLITGTADKLAAKLGLDASRYDKEYYAPAFKLLDDPGACDRIGPTSAAVLDRLIALGGDTTPVARSE